MKLHEIQPFVAARLAAWPRFVEQGLSLASGILVEDGTYPKTPGREAALNGKGLALVVWQIEALPADDDTPFGTSVFDVFLPVIVEENVRRNRAEGGTGLKAEQVTEEVIQAVVGQPQPLPSPGSKPFRLLDTPFRNFGTQNGVQRIAVNLVLRHVITPTP